MSEQKNEQYYESIKENFEFLEKKLMLIEVANDAFDLISQLHAAIGRALEGFVRFFPQASLIFSGLAQLATLGKAKKESKTKRLSQGIKLFTGLGMLVAAGVGIAFPPLGLAMLSVGLGLSMGRTLYKMWRTSSKLHAAQQEFKKAVAENRSDQEIDDIIETKLKKHNHKMKERKINAFVAVATFALVTATVVFPPTAIVSAGLLLGLNLGYTAYRYRKPIKRFFSRAGRSITRLFGFGRDVSDEDKLSDVKQDSMKDTDIDKLKPLNQKATVENTKKAAVSDAQKKPMSIKTEEVSLDAKPSSSLHTHRPTFVSQSNNNEFMKKEEKVLLEITQSHKETYAERHPHKEEAQELNSENDRVEVNQSLISNKENEVRPTPNIGTDRTSEEKKKAQDELLEKKKSVNAIKVTQPEDEVEDDDREGEGESGPHP